MDTLVALFFALGAVILFFLFIALLYLVINPFSTLLHELGHAIFGLIFSKESVTIYVGSYGKKEQSWHFTLKRLQIYWHKNILKARGGLCILEDFDLTPWQKILFAFGGSFFSLFVSTILVFSGFYFKFHYTILVVLVGLFLSSLYSSIKSLIPKKTTIKLIDGSYTYNDGEIIRRVFKNRKIPKEVINLYTLFNEKKYSLLEEKIDILYEKKPSSFLCELAIGNLIALKKYDKALEYDKLQRTFDKYTHINHINCGIIFLHKENYPEAEKQFKQAISIEKREPLAWNNYGYLLILQEKWNLAIEVLKKGLRYDNKHAYIHNNLATALLEINSDEQALTHINLSLSYNEQNAYAHITKGQYLNKKGEYKEALDSIEKARELDPNARNLQKLRKEIEANMILTKEQFTPPQPSPK